MSETPPAISLLAPNQAPSAPFPAFDRSIASAIADGDLAPAASHAALPAGTEFAQPAVVMTPQIKATHSVLELGSGTAESVPDQPSTLAVLGSRLQALGRGAWDRGKELIGSEPVQEAAKFAFFVGRSAVVGALEGAEILDHDTKGSATTELDTTKMRGGAIKGALIGAAKAVHKSASEA